jgi:hypothetical protein
MLYVCKTIQVNFDEKQRRRVLVRVRDRCGEMFDLESWYLIVVGRRN